MLPTQSFIVSPTGLAIQPAPVVAPVLKPAPMATLAAGLMGLAWLRRATARAPY